MAVTTTTVSDVQVIGDGRPSNPAMPSALTPASETTTSIATAVNSILTALSGLKL